MYPVLRRHDGLIIFFIRTPIIRHLMLAKIAIFCVY